MREFEMPTLDKRMEMYLLKNLVEFVELMSCSRVLVEEDAVC